MLNMFVQIKYCRKKKQTNCLKLLNKIVRFDFINKKYQFQELSSLYTARMKYLVNF